MTARQPYTKIAPVRTPLGELTAVGTPRWEGLYLQFEDYRPLYDAHRRWMRGLEPGAHVEVTGEVSTDLFVTAELHGKVRYYPPSPADPEGFHGCGDGCCPPDYDVPEKLYVGETNVGAVLEARDDVVTALRMQATLVGPAMAVARLAHPWKGNPVEAEITVPLSLAVRLDHGGMLIRDNTAA